MSHNNAVHDAWGTLLGFRCDICDGVKTKMWGEICNECREKYPARSTPPAQPLVDRVGIPMSYEGQSTQTGEAKPVQPSYLEIAYAAGRAVSGTNFCIDYQMLANTIAACTHSSSASAEEAEKVEEFLRVSPVGTSEYKEGYRDAQGYLRSALDALKEGASHD